MRWEKYQPESTEYTPIEKWGKDHFSTFAYLASCVVNKKGMLENSRMRTNLRIHRELAGMVLGSVYDASPYPTMIKDGVIENHDDWSCLEEIVMAGFVEAWTRPYTKERVFANTQVRVLLTESGWNLLQKLTIHTANGGKYHDFSYEN